MLIIGYYILISWLFLVNLHSTMNIFILYVDGKVNLAEKINCKESQEREITEVLTIKKEMTMV